MQVQAMSDERADRFDNQVKAWFEPLETDKNARRPKQKATITPTYGVPTRLVLRKMDGIER
jgi:hypothetical protein